MVCARPHTNASQSKSYGVCSCNVNQRMLGHLWYRVTVLCYRVTVMVLQSDGHGGTQ
jgi:hypothetical protein